MLMRLYDDKALNNNSIDSTHLLAAYSILQPAINSTIKLIGKEFGETPHQRKVRKIREYIAKKGGVLERGTLLKSNILPGGSLDYDYVLQTLEERGEIRVFKTANKLEWKYALQKNS